jgi:ubiquinone/menaquinone biosynthesis C-methylase UbiE
MNIEAKWNKHQILEEYHQSHRRPKSSDFQEYFGDFFGVQKSIFDNQVCLEIGCGITGAIHYLDNAKLTIGLDPLCLTCKDLYIQEKTQGTPHIMGVGEYLPIQKDSIDSVFIFGVLDHCIEPSLVIKETSRVLKQGGKAYIRVYTFELPKWIRDNLSIVDPHPHHLSWEDISLWLDEWWLEVAKKESHKVPFSGAWTRLKTGTINSAMKYVGATMLGIEELALIVEKQ